MREERIGAGLGGIQLQLRPVLDVAEALEDLNSGRDELEQTDWLEVDPLAHTAVRRDARWTRTGRSRIRRPAPSWAGYGR